MNNLKSETVNKCFTLLREFIEETREVNNKKGGAILALNQLRKVTAGNDNEANENTVDGLTQDPIVYYCMGNPRADGTPTPAV